MPKALPWIALVGIIGVEIGAGLCINSYATDHQYSGVWMLAAVLLYITIPLLFGYVVKNMSSLVVPNTLWQIGNIIGIALLSFLLGERLTGWNWVGVCFAVIAALCMLSTTTSD